MSVSETVYDGAATVGRAQALLQAVILTLVGIGVIVLGSYLLLSKPKRTYSINDAVLSKMTCPNVPTTSESTETVVTNIGQSCSYEVTYTYLDKSYTSSVSATLQYKVSNNDKVTIWIDPNNPIDLQFVADQNLKIPGIACIGLGSFLIIGFWMYYFVMKKSKVLAAVSGTAVTVNAGANIVQSIFKKR